MVKIRTDEEIEEKASEIRLVTIKNKSGFPETDGTEIRDIETGELIPFISYVELSMGAETGKCEGILHQVIPVEVKEFEHTVKATIIKVST